MTIRCARSACLSVTNARAGGARLGRFEANARHRLLEELPVLRHLNRFELCADELNTMALKHARLSTPASGREVARDEVSAHQWHTRLCQRDCQVERGLAAHGG